MPPNPWDAEWDVGAALAAQLLELRVPQLAVRRIAPFGNGWDNTAYLVNGAWVFRFPRRRVAVPLLETEVRALPRLAPRLPLAVPVPELVGHGTEAYPPPFAGYRLLPGQTACRLRLSAGEREGLSAPLGRFLRVLHDVPADGLDLPPDLIGRLDFRTRAAEIEGRLRRLEDNGHLEDARPWCALLEEEIPTPEEERVVHGDLYARHLLVGEAGLSGVLDWGDLHVGDPAVDLSLAYGFLPPSARRAFFDAYGPVDERTRRLARLRALHHASAVLLYGLDVGDADLAREGRLALEHVRIAG